MPLELWHCLLVIRKSIWPVKMSDGVLVWLFVWIKMQIVFIWSSWCHCIPKPYNLLPHINPDWCYLSGTGLPRLSMEKRPLNGCSSSSLRDLRQLWKNRAEFNVSEYCYDFCIFVHGLSLCVGTEEAERLWPSSCCNTWGSQVKALRQGHCQGDEGAWRVSKLSHDE